MHLKKIIFVILSISIFSITAIADENKIQIACDIWPPYQIDNDGNVEGFSTKVVKETFKRMNVEIENLEAYPWKRALYMVEKAKVDALFSANYTKERTQFAYYPDEELVQSPWVIWSREEDEFIYTSLDDLIGKKIGTVRGYSYTPEFLNFLKKHSKVDEVTDDATNFKKLNAGRIDVAIAELGNGYSILKDLNIKKITPHKKHPIKADGLYIMFNKNRISQGFVKKFSEELKKIKQESVYKIWHDEYFQ